MRKSIVVGLTKVITDAVKSPAGRHILRFGKGLSRHSAGQYAKRGAAHCLGKTYKSLSDLERKVVDEIAEVAARTAFSFAQDELTMHLRGDELEEAAEKEAHDISSAIVSAINSRVVSNAYDFVQNFAFGELSRDGRIIIKRDLIKQAILAAIGEIIGEHQRDLS